MGFCGTVWLSRGQNGTFGVCGFILGFCVVIGWGYCGVVWVIIYIYFAGVVLVVVLVVFCCKNLIGDKLLQWS